MYGRLCTNCVQTAVIRVKKRGIVLGWVDMLCRRVWIVWTVAQLWFHWAHTFFTHVFSMVLFNAVDSVGLLPFILDFWIANPLRIQPLPYLCNLLPYNIIQLDGLFYFIDRMDCGGMVFAPQFTGDFRKTQMQFAPQ